MTESGQIIHVWRCDAASPAWNMAADELLLREAAVLGQALLRFYSWNCVASSFGYFQRYADVEKWTESRPLIRRPTGGGLVCHDEYEWTYSMIFPPNHKWWQLKAEESYRRVHNWLKCAFDVCGVPTELCTEKRSAGPGQCFVGAEKNDLQYCGKKIAGAAQRRNRNGLLIQGSVHARATGIDRETWEAAMLQQNGYIDSHPPESFTSEVCDLAKQKYESDGYNCKR